MDTTLMTLDYSQSRAVCTCNVELICNNNMCVHFAYQRARRYTAGQRRRRYLRSLSAEVDAMNLSFIADRTSEVVNKVYRLVMFDGAENEDEKPSVANQLVDLPADVKEQGQVQSNQTGTKPTSASTIGNGNTTSQTFNFYGSEYAIGYNPSQQTMDPDKFTKPLAETAQAALGQGAKLDSPSVEACGYSDRLMQIVAGNTCITTQEAAATAVVAYGEWPSYQDQAGEHVDMPTRPGPSCDRFYTLPSILWGKTDVGGWAVPLPGSIIDMGVFGQNCSFHYLFRSGFAVHVQCNASKFHSGCLIVAMIPEAQRASTPYPNGINVADPPQYCPINQLTLFPHQLINLRSNNSATIVYPYTNFVPASFPHVHNFVTLYIGILVPIDYSVGASPYVPVTVSIAPVCSEFAGLRNTSIATQGLTIPMLGVPGSNQFMTTLRNVGLPAYPEFSATASLKIPGKFTNLLEPARVATFCNPDSLYIEVDNSATQDLIAMWDMALTSTLLEPTYVSRLSRFYANYRGNINLQFVFCGTAMATAKFLISYCPPGAPQPTTRTEAMLGTYVVWDVGLQSTISFTVPYISVSQYRAQLTDGTTLSYDGYISIWYQTSVVVPPGSPSASKILVMASAADNFLMRIPADTGYFQGDPIQEAIAGVTNHALQQLQASTNAPNTNTSIAGPSVSAIEAATSGSLTNGQLHLEDAGASTLMAAEVGGTQTGQGGQQLIANVNTVFSTAETDLEYLLSRYSLYTSKHNVGIAKTGNTITITNGVIPVNSVSIADRNLALRSKILSCTYFRCALDFVVIVTPVLTATKRAADDPWLPTTSDLRYQFMFVPQGGLLPSVTNNNTNTNQAAWYSAANPSVYAMSSGAPATLRIPFLSVANAFTTRFDGYRTYNQNDYGVNPANEIGNICIRIVDNTQVVEGHTVWQTADVKVFVRPINIEAFLPRPLVSLKTTVALANSRGRVVPVRDADEKPQRTLVFPENENLQEVEEQGWVDDYVNNLGNRFGMGAAQASTDEIKRVLAGLNLEQQMRSNLAIKITKMIVKTVCGVTAVARSGDPIVAMAVTTMLGIDILESDPFEWLKARIVKALGVGVLPQGLTDWAKDFNTVANSAKALDWIWQKISQFVDWIKSFFKETSTDVKRTQELIAVFPQMMAEWDEMERSRRKFTTESITKLALRFLELKELASITNLSIPATRREITTYAVKAQKYLTTKADSRVEPVGVLISGAPGTGKSLACEIIGRQLSPPSDRPYSMPPDPKYFDGYMQQDVVIMDDLGQNPDGLDCSAFCQMVSSNLFYPPMADLPDKGMSFTSTYVLASTNHQNLHPPTISDSRAFDRRFWLKTSIQVSKSFERDGKLDVALALKPCDHKAKNFQKCCPMICGKAITLKCTRTGVSYSLDSVVGMCQKEAERRASCGNLLDNIFEQGPHPEKVAMKERHRAIRKKYNMPDSDEDDVIVPNRPMLRTVSVDSITPKPPPAAIADLLASVHNQDVVDYCVEKGWLVPQEITHRQIEAEIKDWMPTAASILAALASVAALSTVIYVVYRFFSCREEGAYSGVKTNPIKKPEERVITVQGPDYEFANKLMQTNIVSITTNAEYTSLALYDNWFVVPTHSYPGEVVLLNGVSTPVLDTQVLVNQQGVNLELTLIQLECGRQYRDIRKFLSTHLTTEADVVLLLNTRKFPRIMIPVGMAVPYGTISLSGRMTTNTYTYGYPTQVGQCGGVLVKAGKIVGIHIGGDGRNGYGSALKVSYLAHLQGEIVAQERAPKPINISTKTALQPSIYHDLLDGTKEPAVLSKYDNRCEVDFEAQMFSKYKGNVPDPKLPELDMVVESYAAQLLPLLPPDVTRPLTLEEAVYGFEGLDGLDLATSAGYPYVTMGVKKKDLIPHKEEKDLSKLMQALDLHGYGHPFVTYLKDELRKPEKVKTGNTRLIECSSLNDTIRMKVTFGRLFAAIHQNPGTLTGVAVGCNPDVDWTKFAAMLGDTNIIEFDYKNYDASISPFLFHALKKLLQHLGYTAEQVSLIDGLNQSTHIYKGMQYSVLGGMPSGCSGTSIFNSLINNIIIKFLCSLCYKNMELDLLRIISYGDDVLFSYPFPLSPRFIAETGKILGLTITPADKGEEFGDPKNITEVVFLKRKFKFDHEFPFLVHPIMDWQEMMESLRWTRSAAQTQEHVASICEMAWHHGEDKYNSLVAILRTPPAGRALYIKPYSYYRRRWLDQF
uniref:Genome polyprotein n=1 Tax=Guangxi changeable lizard picornavirus 2 TaxID=2116184 RepID=A0A2P1GN84_9VIRU|nr:polyprotein [Guangxi changeable lizard picornavirus 2]